jgi:putative transposase
MITEWCKYEFEEIDVNLIHEAYRNACKTRTALIKKRKQGQNSYYHFLSKNDVKQRFIVLRLGKTLGFNIYPKLLGSFQLSEDLPKNSIGKNAVISFEYGRWFLNAQDTQIIEAQNIKDLKIIALDCGVRTFQTGFSENAVMDYGKDFVADRLVPLMLRVDKLLGIKAKLSHLKSCQFKMDKLKEINKKINKLRVKQQNLVNDLHRRVAYDLVTQYDVILLPEFETTKMTSKKGRRLHKKTVRSMLSLGHYKFKVVLKWFAKKYGKQVIIVNESYTSKTLWDGSILTNLGGKKTITHKGIKVNRDEHGARNILIRFLTSVLDFSRLKGASPIINTKPDLAVLAV